MGRRAGVHWDRREQAWRTDAGRQTTYFRGIAREDQAGANAALGEWLKELKERADANASGGTAGIDVVTLVSRFIGANRGVKPSTRRGHRERLVRFCMFPEPGVNSFGARRASEITVDDLDSMMLVYRERGHSETSRAGMCNSVKACFAWAASGGASPAGPLIPKNPFAGYKAPSIPRSPVRYASRAEIAAYLRFTWRHVSKFPTLWRHFGRIVVFMVRVELYTGARPAELCSAFWEDFDPLSRTITLPPERHKTGGKTGRPRVIRLTPILTRHIERMRRQPTKHPLTIFTRTRGRHNTRYTTGDPMQGIPWGETYTLPNGKIGFDHQSKELARKVRDYRKFAIAEGERLKAAGQPTRGLELLRETGANRFVMYRLRHTIASDHLMNGGNHAAVAELLGTSPRVLETTYGHLLDSHLTEVADELNRLRRKR